MKKIILPLSLLTLAATASAQIVSFNFSFDKTDLNSIDGAETYGIPGLGTVVGNWTNETWFGSNLPDSNGIPTTIAVSGVDGFGPFKAGPDNTPMSQGHNSWSGAGFDVTGLSAVYPDGFDAVIYLTGANWANSSITDGATTYYFSPMPGDATLVQTMSTDSTDVPEANYAVFTGLTGDSISFTLANGGAAMGGFQLLPSSITVIPEPSALALLGGFVALGMILRRRR